MDIILILLVFIAGLLITCIFKRKSNSHDDTKVEELSAVNERLRTKPLAAKKKLASIEDSSSTKANEKITKYEVLLKEATIKIQELDQQLKSALAGKIDDNIKTKLGEIDKLNKKVKDLEDELEETEDDLSDARKKIKIKDSDIAELQETLCKEQKATQKLSIELTSIKKSLEEKIKDLNLKIGLLDFIQELLSSKELSTADTNKLYKSIDFFESFVKGQFTDLNAYLFTLYPLTWNEQKGKIGFENKKKYFHDAFDQWASTKRKSWLDGKRTVAFVGEFSSGKTSIVNRILSQDNPHIPQLPVSAKATTAIPTYIAGGSTTTYSFISGDGKRKVILEETFKKVSKDILNQAKGVSSLIKYFVMTYKNPNLNGLSILDTPGFNSNDSEDKERTIDVINECDALFWVFDVNTGEMSKPSISIIKEKLNKPLYVVINKVDTKAESEVQIVERKIKETLSKEGIHVVQFITFSSKAPLANIMNPIKSVKKISTRDTFVSDVRTDIELLLEILRKAVASSNEKYNKTRVICEEMDVNFYKSLRCLQSDCEDAAGIPQRANHWFSDTDYRMTISDGDKMKNLLKKSKDRAVGMHDLFRQRIEKAQEIQQDWSDLCDLKTSWQKINECLEQYKKVSKEII